MKFWLFLFISMVTGSVFAQTEAVEPTDVSDSSSVVMEQLPVFHGGAQGMVMYLAKETKYPKKARKKKIQGRVYVQFTVETDGSVTNVKIVKGVDPELDAEALRVVKNMPAFEQPALQRGKPVPFIYNLPLNFSL